MWTWEDGDIGTYEHNDIGSQGYIPFIILYSVIFDGQSPSITIYYMFETLYISSSNFHKLYASYSIPSCHTPWKVEV